MVFSFRDILLYSQDICIICVVDVTCNTVSVKSCGMMCYNWSKPILNPLFASFYYMLYILYILIKISLDYLSVVLLVNNNLKMWCLLTFVSSTLPLYDFLDVFLVLYRMWTASVSHKQYGWTGEIPVTGVIDKSFIRVKLCDRKIISLDNVFLSWNLSRSCVILLQKPPRYIFHI